MSDDNNGKPSTREEILASLARRRYRNVPLPFAGITVRIQSLSEQEWASYLAAMKPVYDSQGKATVDPINSMDAERKLVGLGVVDHKDERVFKQPEDAGGFAPPDVDILADAIKQITVVSRDQTEALVKNSETTSDDG